MTGFSRKLMSTIWTWGKEVMSFMRMRMRPLKVMSSRRMGIAPVTTPLPTRMSSTIFGLTLAAAWRGVMSDTSFGVKERPQSIMTMSSAVRGKVRTLSMRGALVPSVNVLRRSESRNGGVAAESVWSTEETTVADSTGS
jgi:hypothetical protein